MGEAMLSVVATTVLGTLVGWLLASIKAKAAKLGEAERLEERERSENRAILGELLFYRLTDLHKRYVIDGQPCSAAEKQQVEDVYHHYHEVLHLNGPGTHMYNEIMDVHQS